MRRFASTHTGRRGRPRAIIFDLFQTLVFFDASKLPVVEVGAKQRPSTIVDLPERLAHFDPNLTARDFLASIEKVGRELSAEKRATGREISSRERFERALRVATEGSATAVHDRLASVADGLVDAHMGALAAAVYCPQDRHQLLEALGAKYLIGLLSNFDHGPTAHILLDRLGLSRWLAEPVVSDDVGYCKPAPQIFHLTCERLGVSPEEAVFVGDSMEADVLGAAAAGLTPIWVGDAAEDKGPAVAVVSDVAQLPQALRGLGWD